MKTGPLLCLFLGFGLLLPVGARAEWKATETVRTYAISGKTGADLYASIGEHGPKIGGGTRTIAYTDFKLTWTRNYVPQAGGCTLVSAVPKLVITYVLPKPSGKLPAAIAGRWDTFVTGVRNHERVHGDIIRTMVAAIEAESVGLSVSDDPGCRKIRTELNQRLSRLSLAQRAQSRDFDRAELADGGAIHQLVLDLVNAR